MAKKVYDLIDATGNIVAATITLSAPLATSATVGRQSTVITLASANRVPPMIEVEFKATLTTGSLANDQSAYLWMARSLDETNYEVGPPAIGASDAAFTFSNSPVGTGGLPTDFLYLGALKFNAQSQLRRRVFRVFAPPAKFAFVVLNYSGINFTSTAGDHGILIRKRWPENVTE